MDLLDKIGFELFVPGGIVSTLVGTDILADGIIYQHEGRMIFGGMLTLLGYFALRTAYNNYKDLKK